MAEFQAPAGSDQKGMQAQPIRKTHTFYITHRTPEGVTLEGQFTCKKLSIKELSMIGVRRTQLNGGYHYDEKNPGYGIDEETNWTNQMFAHLEMCLMQRPIWFKLDEIEEAELLVKVYGECAKFENSFSPQRGAATSVGGSQADSGGAREQPGAAGRVAPVGGGQVSPPLDP